MLQYEMGCRLLTFLQKLWVKFVSKRKHGKRGKESSKENEEGSSRKRAKSAEHVENDAGREENTIVKEEATATKKVDDAKIEDKIEEDPEEDPEEEPVEEPEEDEGMQDISHHHDPPEEKLPKDEKIGSAAIGDVGQSEQSQKQENADQTPEKPTNHDPSRKNEVESETKRTNGVIDKDLLQAFRFFDRNRVGYIRVEDMRVIIHNLGKFLSNRDVKELVQSALLEESNTGRDDKILYDKIVKISAL